MEGGGTPLAGVGLILEGRGRGPAHVAELRPGGPAERCGRIRLGDTLVSVDGRTVAGTRTPNEIAAEISGVEKTEVKLGFVRTVPSFFGDGQERFEVTLMRQANAVPHESASNPACTVDLPVPRSATTGGQLARGGREDVPSPQHNAADPRAFAGPAWASVHEQAPDHRLQREELFQDTREVARVPEQSRDDGGEEAKAVVAEIRNVIAFIKSGYTSPERFQSEFMHAEGDTPNLLRILYEEIGGLKSREASGENVLRVAKETLDARKNQIRNLAIALKKAQLSNDKTAHMPPLSESMESAARNAVEDGEEDPIAEAQERERRALEKCEMMQRKLGRALQEIVNLRGEGKARKAGVDDVGQEELSKLRNQVREKDARIVELRDYVASLEEDSKERTQKITEVSQRLMEKRKEERDMIEHLRGELAKKEMALTQMHGANVPNGDVPSI